MAPRKRATPSGTPSTDERLAGALFVPHIDLLELPTTRAATPEDDYPRILESICGATDDSQPVEQYDGTLGVTRAFSDAHQSPVAQVQWNANLGSIYTNPGNVNGVRWGTGTMISADLFLTCGHLFDQTGGGWERPRVNGTTNIISPQQIATNMHLNFNYQVDPAGTLRTEQSFAITQLIEYRLGGVDMAVCRIAGNPGSIFGFTEVSTVDAAIGDMLAIIGHPAGQPKRIEAGPCTNLTASQILYNDIDTLGGNSGSGILAASTGRLVGVHTNGGCNPAGSGSNFGQPIVAIRNVSPTLQNLAVGTGPLLDTTKALDVIATITQIDQGTGGGADTSFVADQIGTLVTADTAKATDLHTLAFLDTSKAADQIPTATWKDVGTLRWTDTSVVLDQPGGGTSIIRDVATSPVHDLGGPGTGLGDTAQEGGGIPDPGGIVINPALGGGGGGLRPFVLANPHHFEGATDVLDERAAYEEALEQLEAAMAAQAAALEQVQEQYTAVYAEYAQRFGGDPS